MRSAVGGERGAVTVEAAIALCALLVVFGLVVGGIAAVTTQLRCTDAAGAAARLIARGQPELAEQAVADLAPGARLTVDGHGKTVTVAVLADPVGGLLPGIEVRGEAAAVLEPGVGPPQVPAETVDVTG